MKFQSSGKMILVLLAILLVLTVVPTSKSSGHFSTVHTGLRVYEDHYPIRINNDTDFAAQASAENWTGDGSANNPYKIDGYAIDATGYGAGIYIGNTTVHFIIKNGTYQNAEPKSAYGVGAGIMLVNVQNAIIENNDIEKNSNMGIYIEHSSNIDIYGNTIKNNKWGTLLQATTATVENNKIYNNTLTGILISNSNHTHVNGNSLYGNPSSVEIRDSYSNTVYNNSMDGSNSGSYGILIDNSTQNNILNNTVQGNRFGIYLEIGSSNQILGNIILRNTQYGIYVDVQSSNNLLYENELFYNHGSTSTFDASHVQACDNGTGNTWYSSTHRGNYWYDWAENNNTNDNNSDGIVDWPYPLDGSAGAKDSYPLKNSSYNIPELNIYLLIFAVFAILTITKFKH